MEYDRKDQVIMKRSGGALGDSWGRGGDANGKSVSIESPGRNPLGFAIELLVEPAPVDCLVPMGRAAKLQGLDYFGTRHH